MTNAKHKINSSVNGLTKREEFAARAMQGLLANPDHSQKWTFEFIAKLKHLLGLKSTVTSTEMSDLGRRSVAIADELIEALNENN
jgi:hypothetical protein